MSLLFEIKNFDGLHRYVIPSNLIIIFDDDIPVGFSINIPSFSNNLKATPLKNLQLTKVLADLIIKKMKHYKVDTKSIDLR